MPWTPSQAIITARAIPDNLIAYVLDATRHRDALTWAGDTGAALKLIKTFGTANAARTNPVYPIMYVREDDDAQEFGDGVINAAYTVTFEIAIQSLNADTAITNAKKYVKAICSMIRDCPIATVISGTGAVNGVLENMLTGFAPIKTNEQRNDFLQEIQVRCQYTLTDGAFE